MAAHPEPIVSYKAIRNKIKEINALFRSGAPLGEDFILLSDQLDALDVSARLIWRKFNKRYYLARLLAIIDKYPDPEDVPAEFATQVYKVVESMEQSSDIAKAALANSAVRRRLISNLKRSSDMFVQNEMDEAFQDSWNETKKINEYIDDEVERKLLSTPPDPEMIEKLSNENEELIRALRNRILQNDIGGHVNVGRLIREMRQPEVRARIYARLGDYSALHEALDSGARQYGYILAAVTFKDSNQSPWYILNTGDRRLLTQELTGLIEADKDLPGHRYELYGEGGIYEIKDGMRRHIGRYKVEWLEDEE